MEFEYTGTIYIDVDYLFEKCIDRKAYSSFNIYQIVNDYIAELDDIDYYHVEGWMVDKIVTEIKKRVDKVLED